mmetsp:Transcript_26782/g.90169  ORF Transcript_26782/g.90169 Transcript_26782/m.90169 type:complete len:246 (-) Transcript_26782:1345-2082(-)
MYFSSRGDAFRRSLCKAVPRAHETSPLRRRQERLSRGPKAQNGPQNGSKWAAERPEWTAALGGFSTQPKTVLMDCPSARALETAGPLSNGPLSNGPLSNVHDKATSPRCLWKAPLHFWTAPTDLGDGRGVPGDGLSRETTPSRQFPKDPKRRLLETVPRGGFAVSRVPRKRPPLPRQPSVMALLQGPQNRLGTRTPPSLSDKALAAPRRSAEGVQRPTPNRFLMRPLRTALSTVPETVLSRVPFL